MAKLLITGASGLLGSNLLLHAMQEHEVVGVTFAHPIFHPKATQLSVDLREPGAAVRMIEETRPDWIVNCAAATDVDWCELEPSQAMRMNRDVPGWLAEGARLIGARMIHISTDAVFDGETGSYVEQDPPNPVNVYGRSKLEGEHRVLDHHPGGLILRTNIYGWNAREKPSLAEWFLAKLRSGESCMGFTDVIISPISVSALAELLVYLLPTSLSGVYHAPGAECLSKFDFSQKLAEVFGLDGSLVRPGSVDDLSLPAVRPKRLCLEGGNLRREAAVDLPTIEESLDRLKAEETNGRRDQLRALVEGSPKIQAVS